MPALWGVWLQLAVSVHGAAATVFTLEEYNRRLEHEGDSTCVIAGGVAACFKPRAVGRGFGARGCGAGHARSGHPLAQP